MFNHHNLIYLVLEIKIPGFEELGFVVSFCITAFKILKTIIFVDNIDIVGQLDLYLQSRFFLRPPKKLKLLIQIFSANLIVDTRSLFLKDFGNKNTRIWICIECVGMGLNFRDIKHIYQWKLSNFIIFPKLV